MNLSITKITEPELSRLMQKEAMTEGWHYSQDDVDFYFKCKFNQIYSIKVDDELAGCVILHESMSHIQNKSIRSAGFFYVIEKYRGQKIVGPYLWKLAITEKINKDMIVCFHSVPRAVNFYETLGFRKTPLVNLFYALNTEQVNHNIEESTLKLLEEGVLKLKNGDVNEIDIYNENLFSGSAGLGFREFLHYWVRRSDAITIAYYDHDVIRGHGIATICKEMDKNKFCYRISPIYADTPVIANAILKALVYFVEKSNGQRIELNSLASTNEEFRNALNEMGFAEFGKNYIVCNQSDLINVESLLLDKIFCSLPLEYPHEVVAGLTYTKN